MLKLVLPPGSGQEKRPRSPRACLILTDIERAQLRIVLRNLHGQYGTWSCLAAVMDVNSVTLSSIASGKKRGSPGMLLRAARAAGLPLERILSASLSVVNRCPTCGRST